MVLSQHNRRPAQLIQQGLTEVLLPVRLTPGRSLSEASDDYQTFHCHDDIITPAHELASTMIYC